MMAKDKKYPCSNCEPYPRPLKPEVSEEEYMQIWLREVANGSDLTYEEFRAFTRITV